MTAVLAKYPHPKYPKRVFLEFSDPFCCVAWKSHRKCGGLCLFLRESLAGGPGFKIYDLMFRV